MLHRTWIFCTGGATEATGTGGAAAAASADGLGAGGSGRKDLRLQVLLAVVEPESAVGWHAVRQLTRHGGLSRSVDARTHGRLCAGVRGELQSDEQQPEQGAHNPDGGQIPICMDTCILACIATLKDPPPDKTKTSARGGRRARARKAPALTPQEGRGDEAATPAGGTGRNPLITCHSCVECCN